MNTELLKQKMREYFDNISPEELITKFEKMGYSFVDVTPQSEPLPDSGGNKSIQQLIKMVETRMSLVDSLDDATPSDRARYDVYVDMLAALKDASTVSEAGEDTIGFAEWVVSDNNPAPNKYNSDDDNNGKWCDAFSEGINRHYYTTEQLYKIYRKQ